MKDKVRLLELKKELMQVPNLEIEHKALARGFKHIVGIDEAGRGPLAGPVVVAAVILGNNWDNTHLLNDSKKLTAKKRESLFETISTEALAYKIVSIPPQEIDTMNVLQATLLGMLRCIEEINPLPDYVLVDGNNFPKTEINGESIVKGDCKSKSIAAASILAKVTRDRFMVRNAKLFPKWGFEKHKGYPTKHHREMILKYGISPLHRKSFQLKPIKSCLF